jgi:hypothetical protein
VHRHGSWRVSTAAATPTVPHRHPPPPPPPLSTSQGAAACTAYDRALATEERLNDAYKSEHAKLCPNPKCKAPTEKSKGCNHMTCSRCHQDWCWLCGEQIERNSALPSHFKVERRGQRCFRSTVDSRQ